MLKDLSYQEIKKLTICVKNEIDSSSDVCRDVSRQPGFLPDPSLHVHWTSFMGISKVHETVAMSRGPSKF